MKTKIDASLKLLFTQLRAGVSSSTFFGYIINLGRDEIVRLGG